MAPPKKTKSKSKAKKRKQKGLVNINRNNGAIQAANRRAIKKTTKDSIRKRLKIGRIRRLQRQRGFNGKVDGDTQFAYSFGVGDSKSYLYKDNGGKKLHISKVERGKEADAKNMVEAVLERNISAVDQAEPLTKISIDMDQVADLELFHRELSKLNGPQIDYQAKGLSGRKFSNLNNYLVRASGNRTDSQEFRRITSLLDRANQIDRKESKSVADANEMLRITRAIQNLIPEAESSKTLKQGDRNKALENLHFLLNRENERLQTLKTRIQNSKIINLNRSEERKTPELSTSQPADFVPPPDDTTNQYLLKVKNQEEVIGTFKPESQEVRAARGEANRGEGTLRDVLGFTLARANNLTVVPTTRLAAFNKPSFGQNSNNRIPDSSSDKQVGSMQAHPDNSDGKLSDYLSDQQKPLQNFDRDSIQEMAILDVLGLNVGRTADSMVLDNTGKLHAMNQDGLLPDAKSFENNSNRPFPGWGWANLPGSNQPFSQALANQISQIDVDQMVNNMQQESEKISKKMATVTGEDPAKILPTPDQLDLMRFAGRVLKLGVAAGLTPAQIESIFNGTNNNNQNPSNKTIDNITGGGEFAEFVRSTFLINEQNAELAKQQGNPPPDREFDFAKAEEAFREKMSFALNRLGVDMNNLQIPNGIFTRQRLNVPGAQPVPADANQRPERIRNPFTRYKQYRQRLKDKNVVGNIINLNTVTASDVFSATTQGSIDKTGTNKGFAKKAVKKNDPKNDGAWQLFGGGDTFEDDPNLIARQVISSRIDRALGLRVLAREIFSKDSNDQILGISARVTGKSLKEQGDNIDLYRNFDFSKANTQKGLADLQLLDALTGQMDRHGGNIFIDPETGKVSGIDNDLAFPREDKFGRANQLQNQFSRDNNGKLVYHQELIDAKTAETFLSMDRDELESILQGRRKDPESLNQTEVQLTLERFDAIVAQIKALILARPPRDTSKPGLGRLVATWDDNTFQESIAQGNEGNNYVGRSVHKFLQAGDANVTVAVQEL